MNHFSRIERAVALLSAVTATTLTLAAPSFAQETFKLGIVTFLSGPAADSFGVPARNGAQYVIDQLNKGSAPAPYEKVGCATSISATMSMPCSALSARATVLRSRLSLKN